MFKTFRVGTVYGIPFRLDVTFLITLPVFVAIMGGRIGQVVPRMNGTLGTTIDLMRSFGVAMEQDRFESVDRTVHSETG